MAIDPQIKAQLAQTIYYALPSGTASIAGEPAVGAATSAAARVEFVDREFPVDSTQTVELSTTHWICTEAAITLDCLVWLPGEDQTDTTKARRPKRVDKFVTEKGVVDHYEVYV